jgi:hypothetical protein
MMRDDLLQHDDIIVSFKEFGEVGPSCVLRIDQIFTIFEPLAVFSREIAMGPYPQVR